MAGDAAAAEKSKDERLAQWKATDAATEKREEAALSMDEATFLDDTRAKAFGVGGDGGSLADAVGRRAHYRQGRSEANA